ncbi:hypothetical protein DP59_5222 [Burkholderia pseudomallei]|nr:hypothetical protein DP59_5222 [Burkholderia pseudomallei]
MPLASAAAPASSSGASSPAPGSGGGVSTGSVNQKRAPSTRPSGPSRLSAPILPPCASTIARQIASPRPMPGVADSFSPRVNFSKIRASIPAGSPGPWSSTNTRTNGRPSSTMRSAPISIGVSSGVYFAAFSNRFAKSRSISTASVCRSGKSAGSRTRAGWRASTRLHAASAAPTVSSSSDHWRFSCRLPACNRAMSSRFVTIPVILSASS